MESVKYLLNNVNDQQDREFGTYYIQCSKCDFIMYFSNFCNCIENKVVPENLAIKRDFLNQMLNKYRDKWYKDRQY